MFHHTDQTSGAGGIIAERRREGVVDEVRVRALRRDRDRGVVAAIAGRLLRDRSRPRVAAIGRVTREHVRAGDAVTAVHPCPHDLISGSRSGRRPIGDVDARSRRQVVASTRDAVFHAPEAGAVELHGEAGINGETDVLGRSPRLAAVKGLDHDVRALSWHTHGKLVGKDIDHPVAVSANGTPGAAESLLRVERGIARRRDLLLSPGVSSVR